MATHHIAKGLASLGRNGDSMLMHVSPAEVAGIKAIGDMTGRKLTTNPDTGMPEAFDFGDFFSSLLPTLVGVALAPETFGGSLGITAGSTAAKVAPIVGGMATGAAVAGAKGEDVLTGGLMGGLGGYGGGNLGSSLGKLGAGGGYAAGQTIPTGQAITTAAGKEALNVAPNAFFGTAETMPKALTNIASTAPSAMAPTTAAQGLSNLTSGIGKLTDQGGYQAFKDVGGSASQIGLPVGMAALSAMQPEPIDLTSEEEKRKAEENKYRDPITGKLNLAQASPGLRLMATGGTVNSNQSTVATGGLQDLYGANDNTAATTLSQDGYGIGRLNTLASEGSRAKAADTFYAEGGPIAFADGGTTPAPGSDMPVIPESQLRYMRGPTRSYSGARMGPSYSSGTGGNLMSDYLSTWQRSFPGFAAPALNNPRSYFGGPGSRVGGVRFLEGGPIAFSHGGIFELEAAKGGYLNGAGDGMSDSIPGTIEGKQPARLADGEFVIPADVVSHLGNGSSKAGAKQLYAMMHKVRKARTGNPKQGKEINPNQYMPA